MTDHPSFEQLCDVADGTAPAIAAAAARAHARTCADCASQLESIASLRVNAAALPREIAPPTDLWNDIRGRLRPRSSLETTRMPAWRSRHLLAAGLVIAVASSAVTFAVTRKAVPGPGTTTADVSPAVQTPRALPAQLASDEHRYARSAELLQRTLESRRDSLAPSTVAVIERSLRVADSAIAEARDALARDPSNRALVRLFASNYERKIDLLRRAGALEPRT